MTRPITRGATAVVVLPAVENAVFTVLWPAGVIVAGIAMAGVVATAL
jgi:hypothetical protein